MIFNQRKYNIAVAGAGYVGLSLSILLSQHNNVIAVDIDTDKVKRLNEWKSPIGDKCLERYLYEHRERNLSLHATTDESTAYSSADFIIIATPTNYDPRANFSTVAQ